MADKEGLPLSEKYRDKIARLTLMDDVFMTRVFQGSKELTELVLGIILDKELTVISAKTQAAIENLHGRSVRLDVLAKDSSGTVYDIEIQRSDKGAGFKRARYYSSLIDANALDKGSDFSKLPESYVIFITEHDILGEGEPLYEIVRTIRKSGRIIDDGSHILYVNSEIDSAGTKLGRLMHDFKCSNPQDMHYGLLRSKVSEYKESEQEAKEMGSVFDEVREEGRAEGMAEGMRAGRAEGMRAGRAEGMRAGRAEGMRAGRAEGMRAGRAEGMRAGRASGARESQIKTARNLFSFNLSAEQISMATGLPLENVLELR